MRSWLRKQWQHTKRKTKLWETCGRSTKSKGLKLERQTRTEEIYESVKAKGKSMGKNHSQQSNTINSMSWKSINTELACKGTRLLQDSQWYGLLERNVNDCEEVESTLNSHANDLKWGPGAGHKSPPCAVSGVDVSCFIYAGLLTIGLTTINCTRELVLNCFDRQEEKNEKEISFMAIDNQKGFVSSDWPVWLYSSSVCL